LVEKSQLGPYHVQNGYATMLVNDSPSIGWHMCYVTSPCQNINIGSHWNQWIEILKFWI